MILQNIKIHFCCKSVYGLLKLIYLPELFFRVMNSVYPICKGDVSDGEDKVVLHEKGSAGINEASHERKDSITVNSLTLSTRHVDRLIPTNFKLLSI